MRTRTLQQLARYDRAAQHLDDFIFDLFDLHPGQVCARSIG
jgi:hypothetical protein